MLVQWSLHNSHNKTENFVRIKQNVRLIHTSKSMESMVKHTIVQIKQNMRIIQGSHYPGSTVQLFDSICIDKTCCESFSCKNGDVTRLETPLHHSICVVDDTALKICNYLHRLAVGELSRYPQCL